MAPLLRYDHALLGYRVQADKMARKSADTNPVFVVIKKNGGWDYKIRNQCEKQ